MRICISICVIFFGFCFTANAEVTNLSCECDFIKDIDLKKVKYEDVEVEKIKNCKGSLSVIIDTDKGTISGKYVSEVAVAGDTGAISATFGATGAHAKLKDGVMALTPTDNSGSISWACSSNASGTDIAAYLPSSCQ